MNELLVLELTIFALAIFVGFEVISKVPAMLHTPLMSGTNAIHGIVLIGAMLIVGTADSRIEQVLGFVAVVFGTINVVGGFLVTADAVGRMHSGSVIVDMAASALGGNCELSQAGETVQTPNGITIIAPDNLPATMPAGASQFYARNISNLLLGMVKDGALHLDFEDEIVAGACVTRREEVPA